MPLSQSTGYPDSSPLDPPSAHQKPATSLSITPIVSLMEFLAKAWGTVSYLVIQIEWFFLPGLIRVGALSEHQERKVMNERTAFPFIYSFFLIIARCPWCARCRVKEWMSKTWVLLTRSFSHGGKIGEKVVTRKWHKFYHRGNESTGNGE